MCRAGVLSLQAEQHILSCLLLLAAACGDAPTRGIVDVPHPGLEGVDATAREQIEAARRLLEATEGDDSPPTDRARADRARASGEIGRLYQGYGFGEAAIAAFTNAVTLAPDEFRWLYHLGALELDSGRLDAGREHLEAARAIRPDDVPTLLRLGRAALDTARYDKADELFTHAAGVEPECAAAWFGVGVAALGEGDPARAVDALVQTLDLDPRASQAYRPLAMAYRTLEQLTEARQALSRAGTARPTCPDPLSAELRALTRGASALFERAAAAQIEGRTRAALEAAGAAVEADSEHAAARRLYGQLLARTGDLEEAIQQLRRAAEIDPEDRRAHMLLGRAYRESGDLDASVAALERAIELDPRYARARVELALAWIERDDWRAARRVLDQGLELDPTDLDLRIQRARAMAATGDLERSRSELEAILDENDQLAAAQLALGSLLLDAGDAGVAEGHLERALEAEASPDTYALAHYQLARLAVGRGSDAIAAKHLETATTLSPSFVEATSALGEVELARGEYARAARLFADAVRMRPDLPQPRSGEGLALLRSGRHLDARRRLERANRLFPEDPRIAHLLARVLATAPAPRVRDGERALQLATGLFASVESIPHGETVAMALAAQDRFDEAAAWQQRLLDQARQGNASVGPEVIEALEARLADYRRGRPAREAW